MNLRSYSIRWLGPEDAAQMAQLEAAVHPPEHRFGESLIFEELRATEYDGKNLSVGLYYKQALVGMLLAFAMKDRQEMADFFGASVPRELDPKKPALYLADYAVLPAHRRFAGVLLKRLRAAVVAREGLRHLSVEMFSTTEYAEKWTASAPRFARLGWHLGGRYTFHDEQLGQTLHWLHFDPRPESDPQPEPSLTAALDNAKTGGGAVGPYISMQLPTVSAWKLLGDEWNAMASTGSAENTPPSWDYLRASSAHLGGLEEPFIAVALWEERQAAAIAPLQIELGRLFGGSRRVLTTLPQVSCPLLTAVNDVDVLDAIILCFASHQKSWDALELQFPAAQNELAQLFRQRLRKHGYLVSRQAGDERAGIRLSEVTPPRSYPDAEKLLGGAGKIRFELAPVEETAAAFERYLHLELVAPEDEIGYGAGISSRHISFHREAARHASHTGMRVGFLYVDDVLAAGFVGFLWGRHLQLVHITRSSQFAAQNVGQVALGRLVEACVAQNWCDYIDITSLREEEAAGWANHTTQCSVIRAQQASLAGWVTHCAQVFASGSRR